LRQPVHVRKNFLLDLISMAWENLTPSRRNSLALPIGLSLIWTALVIAGALLTNFDEPYLPFAIAGAIAFFLRATPSRWEIYAWCCCNEKMSY
jgi:hypothetical protein